MDGSSFGNADNAVLNVVLLIIVFGFAVGVACGIGGTLLVQWWFC